MQLVVGKQLDICGVLYLILLGQRLSETACSPICFLYLPLFGSVIIWLLDHSIEAVKRSFFELLCCILLFLIVLRLFLFRLGWCKEACNAVLETGYCVKDYIFFLELQVHYVFFLLIALDDESLVLLCATWSHLALLEMSYFCLKELQLALIFLLFHLKLLDALTHCENLCLELSNLIHDTAVGLHHHVSLLRIVSCCFVLGKGRRVERSSRWNDGQLLLAHLLSLFALKQLVVEMLVTVQMLELQSFLQILPRLILRHLYLLKIRIWSLKHFLILPRSWRNLVSPHLRVLFDTPGIDLI